MTNFEVKRVVTTREPIKFQTKQDERAWNSFVI